jgi:hypothetical protein
MSIRCSSTGKRPRGRVQGVHGRILRPKLPPKPPISSLVPNPNLSQERFYGLPVHLCHGGISPALYYFVPATYKSQPQAISLEKGIDAWKRTGASRQRTHESSLGHSVGEGTAAPGPAHPIASSKPVRRLQTLNLPGFLGQNTATRTSLLFCGCERSSPRPISSNITIWPVNVP